MPRPAKVSVRLGIVFGLVIFFALAFSYVYLGTHLRDLFLRGIKNDLKRELRLNSGMIADRPPEWTDMAKPDRWADQVGSALELRVTLIDRSGRVIGDSYVDSGRLGFLPTHRDRIEVREALEKGYGEAIRYSDTVHEDMLYMAVPVGAPEPWGVVRFAKPLHDIGLLEDELRRGIEVGLFGSLALALLAGGLSAFFLSRPLERIADAADRFLHGEDSVRIAVGRKDEIGRLSRAFNYMADEIVRMRQQKEWLREVLSSIREAIVVTNSDGEIVLLNPSASRLFSIKASPKRAMPVAQIPDGATRSLFERINASGDRSFKEELAFMTAKGERVLNVTSVPVRNSGRYDGKVVVINDLTRLRTLEAMRRDFVSSVSHELRTPLASIKGYTETLLEGAMEDPECAADFLRIIQQEADQLTALVNDVLDLSKIESGKIVYNFSKVDVRDRIEKIVAQFGAMAEKKGVTIDCPIPDGLPSIFADHSYFDILMRNLVENAVKYVDDRRGRVRISAWAASGKVFIEVEDNGIGIAPSDLDRIFERFYRVDKARSRSLGGTGLGLSIVKHIVLAHKGNIEVRSRVNQGTTFTVTLPAAT